jgi:hypothetical protein
VFVSFEDREMQKNARLTQIVVRRYRGDDAAGTLAVFHAAIYDPPADWEGVPVEVPATG